MKNLCHFEMGVWQMLTSSGGLLNADRREGGLKFGKMLLTSYVNAPLENIACAARNGLNCNSFMRQAQDNFHSHPFYFSINISSIF